MVKTCIACKQEKPINDFYYRKANRGRKAHYVGTCKTCCSLRMKLWYSKPENKKKVRAYDRKWREENEEKCREYANVNARARYTPQKRREKYLRIGRAVHAAYRATRRARQFNATPSWVDQDSMDAFYESARRVSECVSVQHEVDHIIPLQGKNISGLHVPENLQVLPISINRRKHNKFVVN